MRHVDERIAPSEAFNKEIAKQSGPGKVARQCSKPIEEKDTHGDIRNACEGDVALLHVWGAEEN